MHLCFSRTFICTESNWSRRGSCPFLNPVHNKFGIFIFSLKSTNHRITVVHTCVQVWDWALYYRGGSGLHSGEVHSAGSASTRDEVIYSPLHCLCNIQTRIIVIHISFLTECLFCSPLWEMVQEGIDLKSIKWTQH